MILGTRSVATWTEIDTSTDFIVAWQDYVDCGSSRFWRKGEADAGLRHRGTLPVAVAPHLLAILLPKPWP